MDKKKNSRRQFLRTAPLAALTTALLPGMLKASPEPPAVESGTCPETTLDYYGQGPFYTQNPPTISNNQLAGLNEPGTRIVISGRVMNLDCTQVIPNTEVDVWHANDAGAYDNTGYNLRGVVTSNAQGFYLFETIWPGKYLNGNSYRPSHIHFKVTPPGFPTLTTQLYFQGDTDIPGDAAASITSGTYDASDRIIPLVANGNGGYDGTWDIVIQGTGVLGTSELHMDKGMLYSVGPNPFKDRLEIQYGVFQPAKVGLSVYDLSGKLVADIEELELEPQKYVAVWEPPVSLPAGNYFIALKVNDLQVHYLKVMKAPAGAYGN